MLTETGRVVAVDRESLWVETLQQSTCGSCSARKGCGHGLLSQMGSTRRNRLRVLLGDSPAAQFKLDDQVTIAIPEQVILHSSFVVYMLPLLCMLTLAAGMGQLFPTQAPDLMTAAGAIAGFVLGITLVRLHAWRHRDDIELQPRLLGRAPVTSFAEAPRSI